MQKEDLVDKYAGLTKGQIKKLKEKEKKQRLQESPLSPLQEKNDERQAKEMGELEEQKECKQEQQEKDKYAGLSKGQIKKLKEKEKKERQEKGDKKQEGDNKKKKGVSAVEILKRNKKIIDEEKEKIRLKEEEEKRQWEEKERLRLQVIEKQKQKKIQQAKERQEKNKKESADGLKMSKKQRQKMQRIRNDIDRMKVSDPSKTQLKEAIYIPGKGLQEKKEDPAMYSDHHYHRTEFPELRSIICCILGHVDTGKTTLLDKLRNTSVQENEAGGITQQIGATYFPPSKLSEQVAKCQAFIPIKEMPEGLLVIDTPGHESFANLRSRGNSLCDIAILVIDLMHGLEKQTLESMELLKSRNTPFVVALNKIDRNYEWKAMKMHSSKLSLENQNDITKDDFYHRLQKVELQLKQKGFNPVLYWKQEEDDQLPLVPTSGITGEGIPDLLSLIIKFCTIGKLRKKIRFNKKGFKCTVMEKKVIQGHGTTLDCLLVDGVVRRDDRIVLLGFEGAIKTKVKALLTPHPMKEMRVKGEYMMHDEIWGANGIKIGGKELQNAVVGTPLFVVNSEQEENEAVELCEAELQNIKHKIKLSPQGVGLAASTLGSMQALLEYMKSVKIPVSYITVGPVSKEDVMLAMKSVLQQDETKRKEQYCCILVFDIKILSQAQKFAEQNKIKIFQANIIYHLTGQFYDYVKEIKNRRKKDNFGFAHFPVIMKPIEVFRREDPIIVGVDIIDGQLRIGTKLSTYGKDKIEIGVVESIEANHKPLQIAKKENGSVAIKINSKLQAGRDFPKQCQMCSKISRNSIEVLKQHFRDEMSQSDWGLIMHLKKCFKID